LHSKIKEEKFELIATSGTELFSNTEIQWYQKNAKAEYSPLVLLLTSFS